MEFLIKEIRMYPKHKYDTVYFGGGTPSLLEPCDVKLILDELDIKEGAEVTLEANPKTVDYEKLKGFREAGINRLSMGIQSFSDKFLEDFITQRREKKHILQQEKRALKI